jgi:hypothetical protein
MAGSRLLLLQMTFARYAKRTAFERPLMSGVAYAVRVTHAEREMFERQQGWSIKKMYSSNKAGNAEVREPMEEYAPVVFAQDGYKHVVSFDMLSGKVRTLSTSEHFVAIPSCCSTCFVNVKDISFALYYRRTARTYSERENLGRLFLLHLLSCSIIDSE